MQNAETKRVTLTGPHLWQGTTISRIMWDVLIALTPAALGAIYLFGWQALSVMLVSMTVAVLTEWLGTRLMGRRSTVTDGSALLTGLLLAFNLPPGVPLWLPAVGAFFAIGIVKLPFGGLGLNLLNPALAARVFLLTAWPAHMNTWPRPFDAVTTATPLSLLQRPLGPEVTVTELPGYLDLLLGRTGGSLGETSALLLLLGAGYLLWRRIIDWRIPTGMIATVALLTWIISADGIFQGDPIYHVLSGGLILGAFFMATDYVTGPLTPRGRWIYGIGIGLLTVLIRLFGSYPEGVSYAILTMNLVAPLLDRITVPLPFGGVKKRA